MINVLVIVMEAITMWLCLHIAFGEKIKKTKGEVVFFMPYVVVCVLCAYELISKVFYLGLWVFVFVWCKVMFGHKIFGSIIRTAIGVVAVGVIELIVMFIYTFFATDVNIVMEIECVIVGCIVLFFAFTFYYIIVCDRNVLYKHVFDENIFVVIICIVAFLIYAKLEFEVNKKMPIIYVFFFTILAVVFIVLCKKQKFIFELEKRTLSYELHSLYGSAYDDLLKEVRRKQHDYKNQLLTIESMLLSEEDETKIKYMREGYLKIIESENEINSLLSKCYNPIIAGYLYTMYIKCRDKGIRLIIDVKVDTDTIDIKTKDVIEILGVFISNSIEHIEEYEKAKRIIYLQLYYEDNKALIEVKNISEPISFGHMTKLFEEGYSTKGNNRGIGLYSVKTIAEKYSSGVHIGNLLMNGENWIQFSVEI